MQNGTGGEGEKEGEEGRVNKARNEKESRK